MNKVRLQKDDVSLTDTLDILKKIVSIPSFVDKDNNERKLLDFIKKYLRKNTDYKIIEQPVEDNRYNIIAYKKKNPQVALFGHTDTVLPQKQTLEPFKPRIENDKLFGLGAVDMKTGIAIMLKMATEFKSDELALVFSVDEEYEFKGALKLKDIADFRPKFIINLEPTDNKILNGCRGITEFSFVVHGKSAHAGRKKFGINAIEKGVELVKLFQKEITKINLSESGKSTINLAYMHGGTLKQTDPKQVPTVTGLGMIIPNYAKMNCEIRIANPEITQQYIELTFNQIASKIKISVSDFHFKFHLGSMFTPKSELTNFENAVKSSGQRVAYGDISLAGYYEIQLLQKTWKSKSIVFGPGPINLSHSVNEYVSLESIETSERCIREYLQKNLT